jgi:hypothetical protein
MKKKYITPVMMEERVLETTSLLAGSGQLQVTLNDDDEGSFESESEEGEDNNYFVINAKQFESSSLWDD